MLFDSQKTDKIFAVKKSELEKLQKSESRLSKSVSPDDISVLHERLVLLSKQLDELHLQNLQRKQQIIDKLNEWTRFFDKCKEMFDWMTKMEMKISQNGELSMEDLLDKLKNVSYTLYFVLVLAHPKLSFNTCRGILQKCCKRLLEILKFIENLNPDKT